MQKYYIGVDVGGTHLMASVTDGTGKILSRITAPTGWDQDLAVTLEGLVQSVRSAMKEAGVPEDQVKGAGIGVPGVVDPDAGLVLQATNLPWRNLALGPIVTEMLGMPVLLGNDADCAALAESLYGSGRKWESFVLLTLGTGVGGGIICHRKIFRGFRNGGAELGHLSLNAFDGPPCRCGRRGCFESYASATALMRTTQKAMRENPDSGLWKFAADPAEVTAKTAFEAAEAGDPAAQSLVDEYTEALAQGIGVIVNIFRPDAILLGGGVSAQGEALLAPVRKKLRDCCFGSAVLPVPELACASLGKDAGVMGAAALAEGPWQKFYVR